MHAMKKILRDQFYLGMSLLIAGVVAYGFSHTIVRNLIQPAVARPPLLYVHAAIFSLWVIFFILQSALVRARRLQWHRRLGWAGLGLGCLIPVLGVSTAIVMTRFKIAHLGVPVPHAAADLLPTLLDMLCFSVPFALAMWWRKRPELHRRLILVASCALTSAAFGRFPSQILPSDYFYAGVDALIFLAVIRDWMIARTLHPVYYCTLPGLIASQTAVMYVSLRELPLWTQLAQTLL